MINIIKRHKAKLIASLLLLSLCVCGIGIFLVQPKVVYAATDAKVQAMETKIKNIQNQKKDVLAKIKDAKNDKTKAAEYKIYIDQQVNLTHEEIDTITGLISELDEKIILKESEIEHTTVNIKRHYEDMKQLMRLTYEDGYVSYLEILLNADDFYDFLTRADNMSAVMDYYKSVMEKCREDKEKLENAKAALVASKASQEKYKEELELREGELKSLQDENESYLLSLERDIVSYQSAYNSYAKAEAELDAELEKYLKELQAKENSQYVGGEFIWPLPLANKRISSPYGYRTLNGVKEFHRGIDLPAGKNTNIYASNGGKVVTATYHYSYGNYVVIDHGGGKSTLYAHANKLNVKVGDVVKQGDVVAFVGTTGHSTGNHLHFEVRISGTAKNPLEYVKQPK